MSERAIRIAMKASETTDILDERFFFEVPEKAEGLVLSVSKEVNHYLTMAVFDSKGRLRGQFLHGGKTYLVIHSEKTKSTPHTISGEIPAGTWSCAVVGEGESHDPEQIWGYIQIDFNPEVTETFADDSWVNTETYPYLSGFDDAFIWNEAARWYKGDLHTHTVYSDGEMTREEIVGAAHDQKLDFIINTDHNIMTTTWPQSSDLLVIPGIELSFYHGHANILNPNQLAYQTGALNVIASQKGVLEAISQSYGEHALVMINHPILDEWTWQYGRLPLAKVAALEIMNAPTFGLNDLANEWAVLAWDFLLNSGYQITGVGGSDVHSAPGNESGELVGNPATYVYSKQLSARALISNIKAGHVVVSRKGFIRQSFKNYLPGDDIVEKDGTITCTLDSDQSLIIEWVVDGEVMQRDHGISSTYTFHFDGLYHWVRVNVRYEDGLLAGVTNPYYYGKKAPEITCWQSVIAYLNETIPETKVLYHED